jgi:diacylglycerol kinase family enzyme
MQKNWPAMLEYIQNAIPEEQFEWVFTDQPLHAMEITQDVVKQGFTHIISVGGDGIANEVANSIILNNLPVTFGMIPMGTSNDVHINYGQPNDAHESLDMILKDNAEKFAVGEITGDFSGNPYYFLDHTDCGVAALAAKAAIKHSRWIKGEFKYTYHAIKKILGFKRNYATLKIDGEEQDGEYCLISASMGEIMGGYKIWPENHHRLGDFAFCIAKGQSRWQLLKLMLAAEKGNHIGKKGVEFRRGKSLEIQLERPWPLQAEGEIFTDGSTEIKINYKPNSINMLCIPEE